MTYISATKRSILPQDLLRAIEAMLLLGFPHRGLRRFRYLAGSTMSKKMQPHVALHISSSRSKIMKGSAGALQSLQVAV